MRGGLSVLALVALAACSQVDEDHGPGPDVMGGPAVDPELDCVTQGYPCTWAEVDLATLERTETLADEATDRLDRGEAIASVAGWLFS